MTPKTPPPARKPRLQLYALAFGRELPCRWPFGCRHLEWLGGPVSTACTILIRHRTTPGRVRREKRRLRINGYARYKVQKLRDTPCRKTPSG